jgi:hypothetical protein
MGAQDALVSYSCPFDDFAVTDFALNRPPQVAYYPSLELSDERNYYERDVLFQWI